MLEIEQKLPTTIVCTKTHVIRASMQTLPCSCSYFDIELERITQ